MNNAAAVAVRPVHRTADMDYLIRFEDQILTLTEDTINTHYIAQNAVRNNKLSYFDIEFTQYKHSTLYLQVPFGKQLTTTRIAICPTHLLVACSCKQQTEKLCMHSHKILLALVGLRGADYFSRFCKPELFRLAEEYPDLFELKVSLEGIRFEQAKRLGSVYLPEKTNPSPQTELDDERAEQVISYDQFGYSLYTIFRQDHLPFLSGFTGQLLMDGTAIKSFGSIFQTSAAPEHLVFTDRQLLLNALGSQIQTLTERLTQVQPSDHTKNLETIVSELASHKSSELQINRRRLLDLWSRALPLLACERFVNRYSDGRRIKFGHKPKKGYTKPFPTSGSQPRLSFTLSRQKHCYRLRLQILKDAQPLDSFELYPARCPLFVFDKTSAEYLLISSPEDIDLIKLFRQTAYELTIMQMHLEHFNRSVFEYLTLHYPVKFDSFAKKEQTTLQIQHRQLRIFEHGDCFCFQPQIGYQENSFIPAFSRGTGWIQIKADQPAIFLRDKAGEVALCGLIRSLHADFAGQPSRNEDYFSLPKNTVFNSDCLADMLLSLKERNIIVTGIEDIAALSDCSNLVDIRMGIHADKDWFEITLHAACAQVPIKSDTLRHAVLENDGQLTLKDGRRARIPASWQRKLKAALSFAQPTKSGMRLSGFHSELVDRLYHESGQLRPHGFKENLENNAAKIQVVKDQPVPYNIRATLRAYQKDGFSWLMFLKDNGWGGILADDMGLGKTLQVLTLLQNVYQNGLKIRPSLLIVPTSLLFNWQQQAHRFAPDLRVVRYHGAQRQQKPARLESADLILTTYKTVLHDIELLRATEFEYVIADEAQAIKNPSSQRYKAVGSLDARFRLAMTGTPVENSGEDLYALMNFVNPGMLGSLKEFNRIISSKQQAEELDQLQKVISTFTLRRTKKQVAKDLPEKTEMVIYCEMEQPQRAVYESYRIRYQQALKEKINDPTAVGSRLYALSGLLKLRQICNSPALVEAGIERDSEPAKIRELIRRLNQITPYHKVLVFSSFTGFLSLIRRQLEISKIGYAYLDGKTREDQRSKMVELFQSDDDTRVFLISLKAGGTGLNLTAAEYVFLMDPWWNPAAESQAIDRCYRIGQTSNVMAYRMICRDTLEEKILNMQAQKRQLADELVVPTDGFLKSMRQQDILELFN